jgi:hypothetical protein
VAAELGEVLLGQLAAVVHMLVVDVDHIDALAAGRGAVFAAVGVPEEVLEDVGQALRAAAEQPDGVGVAGVQVTGLQARVGARQWADEAALNTLGDHDRDGWGRHESTSIIVVLTLSVILKKGAYRACSD